MKKVFLMTMLAGIISLTAKPAIAADNSSIKGSWKCVTNDVPYEYTNSIITIAEKEGKLNGTVKFDNGQEIKLSTIKFNNNQIIMTLYVDGNEIIVDGKLAGTKITGTVDTPDGKVGFVANKVEKKK